MTTLIRDRCLYFTKRFEVPKSKNREAEEIFPYDSKLN